MPEPGPGRQPTGDGAAPVARRASVGRRAPAARRAPAPPRPRSQAPAPIPDLVATVTGATAGEAIALAVKSTVERLVEQQALVQLASGPEAVHQARVATRRLRSDLRTYAVLFDSEAIANLRLELGWFADLLGHVRDTDILLARLQPSLGSEEATDEQREILERLNRQHAKAQMELLTGMAEPRYSALLDSLARMAAAPPLSDVAKAPADEFMSIIVAGTWRKLRSAVRKLDHDPDDAKLHAVRIEAKRARYAAEAAAPAVGVAASKFAEAVSGLQQALGDYNDAVVSADWLTKSSVQMDSSTAFLAGALHEAQNDLGRKARRRWPKAWKRLDRKKIHGWLDVA
jgi:CHAD domain-containing protein